MSSTLTPSHRKKLQKFLLTKRTRVRKKPLPIGRGMHRSSMRGCRVVKGGDILHLSPKGNHIQSIQKTRPYFTK